MNPFILVILVLGLILGTLITFTSSHWLLAWMGLEINTMAIIPLMAQNHHPRAVEAATKYFLAQATAAAMLLFASMSNAWLIGQWDIQCMTHPFPSTLIILALALKIGLAPLHAWMPEVLQGLDLTTGLVMSTWQKLAPFCLMLQIYNANSFLLVALGLLSILIGGWGGLNQTQLRKILAYSSIAHLGWMVLVLHFFPSLSLLALIMYIIMTSSLFLAFKHTNSLNIGMLAISWSKTPALTAIMPLILLSLGGLPPLTGFLPKWLILQELTKQDLSLIATLAALSALLSLYFYLRVSYAMALTIAPNSSTMMTTWRFNNTKFLTPLALLASGTTLLLPLTPGLLSLLMS
uniref:NADH-ubiquinone oxidoreductase chain 2 n=1 Tax=Cubanichthys cubensis TaxID=668544 RepID=A0A068LGQ1_9TELE|nr:NADH dehydrogenase subunit 2 [Cubanichthys cubensis]